MPHLCVVGCRYILGCRDRYSCGADCVASAGPGMLGWLSFGVDECPVANADGFIPITNTTIRESKEYFCTGPGEGGRHVIGIHATGCFDAQNRYAPCFAMADGSSVNGLPEDFEIPNPAGSTNSNRYSRV